MEEFYFYTRGLTVGYHGVPLIKDIELCLKKGEIMTLIGPNGAGKTTILKSIIRQLKPLGGVACLDGSSMEKLTGKELSQKLSVVLTERVRPEMMTCKDVVATGRYPYTGRMGILGKEDERKVYEALRAVHGEELAECSFDAISDGQKQRVMLARALCQQPDIIVLDEPTAALDPVAEAEIYAKFNEIAGDKTAIYISHRLSSCKFCDEIAVFDHGEVVQQGTHEELLGESDGKYYELWNAQAQYYTEESA